MTDQKMKLLEFDQFIGADGNVYPLTDGVNRFVLSFSGFGMPPIEYITQQGPNQHGQTVLDYRLQPRIFQIVYREQARNREGYWNNRAGLLDALKPNRHPTGVVMPGTFRKILPNGSKRDLDGFIQSGPSFSARSTDNWDEYSVTETLRFICHDPVIYNPDSVDVEFTLSVQEELVFPITFPIVFGTSYLSKGNVITYGGTWPEFPTIAFTGPVVNPRIENETTDEKIQLDYDVPAGITVTISLGYGNKTVEDSNGVNLIGAVTENSDLGSFHLAPDPEVADGENTISVAGADADAYTELSISYYERFIGI